VTTLSESEKADLSRRGFLQKFAVGAAVAPLVVAGGCFSGPIGWPNGGDPPTGS
jgi:hypothetical protein